METSFCILHFDDKVRDHFFINTLLKNSFKIIDSENYAIAEDSLPKYDIDLILTELIHPVENALESIRRIMHHFSGLPVVVLTGFQNRMMASIAINLGVSDFLIKTPSTLDCLADTIKVVVNQKHIGLRDMVSPRINPFPLEEAILC